MFRTSDIALAAYLMMQSLKLKSASREPSGRFKFEFDDPDGLAPEYAVNYVNSEAAKFDAHVKNLKNILFKS
jgi:hypothetical protein